MIEIKSNGAETYLLINGKPVIGHIKYLKFEHGGDKPIAEMILTTEPISDLKEVKKSYRKGKHAMEHGYNACKIKWNKLFSKDKINKKG